MEQKLFQDLQATFASGKTRSLQWRMEQLTSLRNGLKESGDLFVKALGDDLRRPAVEALQEALSITSEVLFAIKSVNKWVEPEEVETPATVPGAKSFVYSKPKGVVLIICPFNFPFGLAFRPLIGAIAAGNCCLLKPSELVPNCAKVIQEIIERYLDSSAFRVVQGGVQETTELLKLPFNHFFYTGGGRVGKIVMKAAAEHLATCTLELGGKSPVYIHEDANLQVTAKRLLAGKYLNDGQICIAPDYLLVNEKIKDELLVQLKSTIEKFYGKNKDTMGRLVNEHHFDRVKHLLEEKHGGQIVEGGLEKADRKQRFIPPTIVLNPSPSSQMMIEEIFGPVLPMTVVSGVQQAVQIVSRKDNPLAAYVFTEDDNVATEFLSQVQSGGGCVNDCITQLRNPNLPFGGTGKSGIGAYHGKFTFDCFSDKQSIMKTTTKEEARMYPPYHPKVAEMLKANL